MRPPDEGYPPQQGGYPYQYLYIGQPAEPQWQEPEPEPEPGPSRNGAILRSVLILAAVAGVVVVVTGLIFMIAGPARYGLTEERTALPVRAQPSDGLFQAAPTVPPPLPPINPAPPMQPSTPLKLVVKKLRINAPIKSIGLARDGTIQVPPPNNPNLVGWYRKGPTAGEAGPAVMLGHKDTRTTSAVFSRLHELRYGDQIEVHRQDGTVAVFTVGGVEQADKKTFPTERVYGDRQNAQLHLITCGGTYNQSTGHYTDNVIVYATLTGSHRMSGRS